MEEVQLNRNLKLTDIEACLSPSGIKYYELSLEYRGESFIAAVKEENIFNFDGLSYTSAMQTVSEDAGDIFDALSDLLDENSDVQEKIKQTVEEYNREEE